MECGVLACVFCVTTAQGAFRFVAWGDATDLLEFVVTNSAQIRQLPVPPAFSLFAGDLYDTGFSVNAAEALRSAMDGVQKNSLSGTLFAVRGNHDITGGTNATTGWQSWFDMRSRVSGGNPKAGVPGIGGSNYTFMAGCDSLTYSFDYQNAHFVGMDIVGDITLVTAKQLSWLDADLSAAEARRLQHAFLFCHGPVYSCGSRHGGINAPSSMITVLNKHPLVSAIFGGHAHVFAWTHMTSNRIAGITHPFEAFIVPPVAEGLASLPDTNRCDYGVGDIRGFTTVDVDGPYYTVQLYVQDDPVPRFRKTFPIVPKLQITGTPTNGVLKFCLSGEPSRTYRIEVSSNCVDWVPLSTNVITSSTSVIVSERVRTNAGPRFYRCR